MSAEQAVWAFAEQKNGELSRTSFELLTAGKPLAEKLGVPLEAVVFGNETPLAGGSVAALLDRGADHVLAAQDSKLARFADDLYAAVLAEFVRARRPAVVLGAASTYGRALFPRAAALLGCGVANDVRSVSLAPDGALICAKPTYGGNVITEVSFGALRPALITIRPKTHPEAEPVGGTGRASLMEIPAGLDGKGKVIASHVAAGDEVSLAEADIIVSGGRGIRAPENYALIEHLARVLGAARGASRAIVDGGWVPYARQVGQTGKTVNPKLYIACGISGAIQHLVGMQSSRVIVALNKDKEAPIFTVATYGILGDLFEYLPAITRVFADKLGKT